MPASTLHLVSASSNSLRSVPDVPFGSVRVSKWLNLPSAAQGSFSSGRAPPSDRVVMVVSLHSPVRKSARTTDPPVSARV